MQNHLTNVFQFFPYCMVWLSDAMVTKGMVTLTGDAAHVGVVPLYSPPRVYIYITAALSHLSHSSSNPIFVNTSTITTGVWCFSTLRAMMTYWQIPLAKDKKQLAIFITWGWSSTWWNQPCFPYISRLTSATGGLPSESDLSNDLPPCHQIVVPAVASFPWLTPWRWGHKAKRKLSGGMTSLIALRKLKLALLVQVSNHPCRRNPTCVNKR